MLIYENYSTLRLYYTTSEKIFYNNNNTIPNQYVTLKNFPHTCPTVRYTNAYRGESALFILLLLILWLMLLFLRLLLIPLY